MSDRAGLSDSFAYKAKPHAAAASNIRVSVPPHNKDVFNRGNETIMFNIPCGKKGQYLNTRMSYLKFELEVTLKSQPVSEAVSIKKLADEAVTDGSTYNGKVILPGTEDDLHIDAIDLANKAAHVLALDGGAHALFNSLEIYHGTNLLEQVREYNTIYQLMQDTGIAQPELDAHFSISDGMAGNGTPRYGRIVTPVCVSGLVRDVHLAPPKFLTRSHTHTVAATTNPVAAGYAITELIPVAADRNYVYEEKTFSLQSCDNIAQALSVASLSNNECPVAHNSSAAPPVAEDVFEYARYNQGGVVYDQTQTYTFCIPIMSGILGPQMSKYIPVGSLAADLRLELGIAPFEQAFVSVGGVLATKQTGHVADDTTDNMMGPSTFVNGPRAREAMDKVPIDRRQSFAIKNLELQLEYIEVASDVQSSIEASTGNQYVMSFDSFSNFQNAIPAESTAFTQLIGAKFSSVKTALSIFRDANHINRVTRRGITSRVNPFSDRTNRPEIAGNGDRPIQCAPYPSGGGFYYSVGATHYPPKPIQSDQEAYYESMKSQHMVAGTPIGTSNLDRWTISARRDAYDSDNSSKNFFASCLEGGTFFAAQNFESQSHKSAFVESGLNTLSQNMYLHCRFPTRSQPLIGQCKLVRGYIPTSSVADPGNSHAIYTFTSRKSDPERYHRGYIGESNLMSWQQHNAQLQVDHYIHYDAILVIINGICNTRF